MKHTARGGLYRARDGVIMGVCKGLANYFDLNVFWVRVVAVTLLLFTGLWPVAGLYVVIGLLMKPEPVLPFSNDAEQEFYESYVGSRPMAISRIKRKFEHLDRRLRRMEDVITSRDFDWERRFAGK
jgi:phage shock protein C